MVKGLLKFLMAVAVMAVFSTSVKAENYFSIIGINVPSVPELDPSVDKIVCLCTNEDNPMIDLTQNGVTKWWINYGTYVTEEDSICIDRIDAGNVYSLAEYDPNIDAWVQVLVKLSDKWLDDTWKGEPCKLVELDYSDLTKYAWKARGEFLPANVSAVTAKEEKKAVKIMENGQMYILKDGVKYNMLGVAQ